MTYLQSIALMLPLSIIGNYAGALTYWSIFAKHRRPRPKLSDALSASWYATTGAAVALYFYNPCQ